jgi:hypothetical protein
MSKSPDDKAPTEKSKPIPFSDGSFFSDGSGWAQPSEGADHSQPENLKENLL